jgi:chromosome partitioning protein
MAKLYETVEDVIGEGLNDSLRVSGLICSLYDSRKNLHKEIVEKIKDNYQDITFNTVIRTNVSLPESQTQGPVSYTHLTLPTN